MNCVTMLSCLLIYLIDNKKKKNTKEGDISRGQYLSELMSERNKERERGRKRERERERTEERK